ncbi:hypothetical protein [Woeseia oceani]|uniref:hypothetical protein n=1 Tax=Woeseia oceani TaxID=1548547 RepID=UPI0012EA5F0F|nr:hypothetical protein [Woeseia oceani]
MNTTVCNCEQAAMVAKLGTFQRISWRQALRGLLSPAIRMHRYREFNARLLRDAYCKLDGCDKP